jgi:ABC-type uncharacterized transport system ATPase subunit
LRINFARGGIHDAVGIGANQQTQMVKIISGIGNHNNGSIRYHCRQRARQLGATPATAEQN